VTEPVRPVFGAPPAAAYRCSMVRRAPVWTPLASSGRRASSQRRFHGSHWRQSGAGSERLTDHHGQMVAYPTTNLAGSVAETTLEAALYPTDCHLLKNWHRRSLATWPANFSTRLSPVVTQSTTAALTRPGGGPRQRTRAERSKKL